MTPDRRRTSMLPGLVLVVGCGVATAPTPAPGVQARPPSTGPAPQLEHDPAVEQLAALAVHHDDFARAELYTWTSVEQLRRVRETKVLLVADPTTGGRASPFNRALIAIAGDGSPTAELARLLLEHPDLRRRRYAWPSPFATTMGLGARRYGDSLIRIELDASALIARFEPAAEVPLSFVDMRGHAVAPDEAIAEPQRVAALYHVRGPPEAPIAYREYVVCSEAMIEAWSIATPDIDTRVEAELELLAALRHRSLASLPRAAVLEAAAPDWRSADTSPTPLALWHASLAFDNTRYQPSAAHLDAIRETLRGYEHDGGPPLVHHPNRGAP